MNDKIKDMKIITICYKSELDRLRANNYFKNREVLL
jgi:hypothetical protein